MKKNQLFILFLVLLLLLDATTAHAHDNSLQEDLPMTCCTDEFPTLYLNSPPLVSSAVRELQEALSSLGYYQEEICGIYDERTALAVKSFQHEIGLAEDGVVRYHVWLKLAAEAEKRTAQKSVPAPPQGEVTIVIDTFKRRLTVLSDGKPYTHFPIAIGKAETPSPIGNWQVVSKAMNWGPSFGTRWMGLNVPWGVYGIHGTNKPWSIGSMASQGCFRMWNRDVEVLYPWVKKGTPVIVVGNPFGYMSGGFQTLVAGDKNAAVQFIQDKLKRKGFYQGTPDGLFGPGTEKAVKEFQKRHGLVQSGQISYQEYQALGLQ